MKDTNSMKVTIDVLGKIDSFTKNLNLIQGQLNRLHLSDTLKDSFSNLFTDLEKEINTVQKTVENNQLNLIDEKKVNKSITRIDNLYGTLIKKLNSSGVDTAFLEKDRTALNGILKAQQSYTKEIKTTLKEQEKLNKKLEEAKEAKAKGGQEKNKTKVSSEKYSLMQSREKAAKSTKKNADKKVAEAQAKVDERIKNSGGKYTDVNSKGFKNTAEYQNLKKAIEEATQATNELKNAQADLAKHTTTEKIEQEAKDLTEALDKAEKELQNFNNTKGKESNSKALESVKKQLQELKGVNWSELGVDLNNIKSVEDLEQAYNKLSTAAGVRAKQALGVIETASEQAEQEFGELKGKIDTATNSLDQMSSRQKDIENLKGRILQFFSIGNAVNLFRRAVTSALNTVKELDATMTEAAVVTDFSVEDMWNQLPKYSEEATKLGAKINDLYAATTLYYQQGLKTNAAMGAGVETMKMARIAGLDAAGATEAMTAALRGFNMEVNTMNAQHVNDVYSALAAKSASNVEQISTAMSKTASIASAANMEFETTAALLSQIIETTQEAPETAGTALKTIIARFSEVKKLASSGQSSGEDDEGEVIDVNKIQTALRTVGISMDEFFKGTEGLDDIFLKLAEKWGTLDFETQRYIATMAAGSRQQSRFIAMMSDYSRTTELVSIANNSAGASSNQFGKTMDSLEAKLNKLKNAWDQFLMGLANNNFIKGAIDLLTGLINTINTLINGISGGNGVIKSILSLGVAIGGLMLGSKMFDALFAHLGAKMATGAAKAGTEAGVIAGNSFNAGLATSTAKAPGIFATALAKIRSLFTKKFWVGITKIPPVNTQALASSFKTIQKAQNNITAATKIRNGAMQTSLDIERATQVADKAIIANEKAKVAAMNEVGLAYGFNSAQQATFTSLVNTGIAADVAAKAVKSGLTATIYNEMVAKVAATGATGEEAKAKLADMVATYQELAAKEALDKQEKVGLLTKIMSIIHTKAQTIANKAETGSLQGKVAALIEEKTAQDASNASKLIGLGIIGLIILAIIALIAIIAVLISAIANGIGSALEAMDEGKQIEKLNEEIKALGESASEAKNRFEELAEAREGLDEMQNTLEGLTRGTKEWTQQLVKTNQEVLRLINEYPELAQYVERGKEGQLTIANAGWDLILESQNAAYTSALTAQATKTVELKNVEKRQIFEEGISNGNWFTQASLDYGQFADSGFWGKLVDIVQTTTGTVLKSTVTGIPSLFGNTTFAVDTVEDFAAMFGSKAERAEREATGGLTEEQYTKFATYAADRGLSMAQGSSKEDFKEALMNSLGWDEQQANNVFDGVWSKMEELGTGFDEMANNLKTATLAQKAQTQAIAANIASLSTKVTESEYSDIVIENTNLDEYYDRVAEVKAEVDKKNADDPELIKKYSEVSGLEEDEIRAKIKDNSLSKDTMTQQIATSVVDKEQSKEQEAYVKTLEKVADKLGKDSDEFKAFANLQKKEGRALTTKDFEKLIGKNFQDANASDIQKADWESYIRNTLKISDADLKEMGYSMEELIALFSQNALNSLNTYNEALERPEVYGLKDTVGNALMTLTSKGKLSAEQIDNLSSELTEVALNGGNVEETTQLLTKALEGASDEQKEQAMNLISLADLETTSGIEELGKQLEILGIEINKDFIPKLKEAAKAINDFSIDKLQNQKKDEYTNRQIILNKIKENDQYFSKDEFLSLTSGDNPLYTKDDFIELDSGKYQLETDSLEEAYQKSINQRKNIDKNNKELLQQYANYNDWADREEIYYTNGKYGGITLWNDDYTGTRSYASGGREDKILTHSENFGSNWKGTYSIDDLAKKILDTSKNSPIEEFIDSFSSYNLDTIAQMAVQGALPINFVDQASKQVWTKYGVYGSFDDKKTNAEVAQINGFIKAISDINAQAQRQIVVNNQEDMKNLLYNVDITDWGTESIKTLRNEGYARSVLSFLQMTTHKDWNIDTMVEDWISGTISDEKIKAYVKEYQGIQSSVQKTQFTDIETSYKELIRSLDVFDVADAIKLQKEAYDESPEMQEETRNKFKQEARRYGVNEAIISDFESLIKAGFNVADAVHVLLEPIGDILGDQKLEQTVSDFKTLVETYEDFSKIQTEDLQKIGLVLGFQIKDLKSGARGLQFLTKHAELLEQTMQGNVTAFKELITLLLTSKEDGYGFTFDKETGLLSKEGASWEDIRAAEESGYIVKESRLATKDMGVWEANYDTTGTFSEFRYRKLKQGERYDGYVINDNMEEVFQKELEKEQANWMNPFDKYFNQIERINELLRERNQIEREYARLLRNSSSSIEEVVAKNQANFDNMRGEYFLRQDLYQKRKKEMDDLQSKKYQVVGGEIQSYAFAASQMGLKLSNYATFKNGQVSINWDNLEKLQKQDAVKGELAEAWVKEIQNQESLMEDELEAAEELIDAIYEELKAQNEKRIEYVNTIAEALEQKDQEIIDNAQAVSDQIADTNSEIIDSLQESIDLERQIRDNTKKEEEIADMEARLAYLRRDTSGANAQEIRELEKELEDTREEQADNLIDQEIDRLSKDNEKAQEQRQKQIDLAQAQVDFWKKYGEYSYRAENNQLTEEAFMEYGRMLRDYDSLSEAGKIDADNELRQLYRAGNASIYSTAALDGQNAIYTDNKSGKKFKNEMGVWREVNDKGEVKENGLAYKMNEITDIDLSNDSFTATGSGVVKDEDIPDRNGLGGDSEIKDLQTSISTDFSSIGKKQDESNKYLSAIDKNVRDLWMLSRGEEMAKSMTYEQYKEQYKQVMGYENASSTDKMEMNKTIAQTYLSANRDTLTEAEKIWYAAEGTGYGYMSNTQKKNYEELNILSLIPNIKESFASIMKDSVWARDKTETEALTIFQQMMGLKPSGKYDVNTIMQILYMLEKGTTLDLSTFYKGVGSFSNLKLPDKFKFATGGLADFTGPAWLDGTKSHPELVLNQQDTQNFIVLKDILAEILNGATSAHNISQSTKGDTYYDITIQVDSISSDYDVDQMAARIKQQIYEDSSYRNVNSISLMR